VVIRFEPEATRGPGRCFGCWLLPAPTATTAAPQPQLVTATTASTPTTAARCSRDNGTRSGGLVNHDRNGGHNPLRQPRNQAAKSATRGRHVIHHNPLARAILLSIGAAASPAQPGAAETPPFQPTK